MKRIVGLLLFTLYLTSSCSKSTSNVACTDVDPAIEEPSIIAFCANNSIIYTKDTTGLYYQILDSGIAPIPTLNSVISITYTAKLLDGTTIDQQTTPVDNLLGSLIQAWRVGMQKIGKGGHIKMVAPSTLCYGCNGTSPSSLIHVPANAALYFDITLKDVK